ncbi:MAG: hypothetical protein FWD32_00125 [Firmicutes bacterium]|nr:hypothetical protein [Bacillota bacterium]
MEDKNKSKTTSYKCTSCGAGMGWSIKDQSLACMHCKAIMPVKEEDLNVIDKPLTDEILKGTYQTEWNEAQMYRCNGCGAREVVNRNDLTKICPFCGSGNVVCTDDLIGLKPDSVVPFMIDKKEGANFFTKWLKSKLYAPKACKQSSTAEKLNACYNPVWTFNADTTSTYSGKLGRNETRTRYRNGKRETYTVTVWFNVSGSIDNNYDNYLVQSGEKIKQQVLEKIQPFPQNNYRNYREEYLAGYIAEHYSKNIGAAYNDFTSFVKEDLKRKIMRKHSADHCSHLDVNTTYNNRKYKYLLLPIYISCFYYKNKLYNFYMNACSGKIWGKYPKSFFKILLTVFAVGAIIAGGILLYYYL